MLLILLSWAITLYVAYTIGFAVRRTVTDASASMSFSLAIVWGLCSVASISILVLFVARSGLGLLIGFLAMACASHYLYRQEIQRSLLEFIYKCRPRHLVAGVVLLFCLLVFSAQPSKINDDGFYYAQTVMWYSEAGLVQGISNLLLPLGLGSSWHVLQSVFSFDSMQGIRLNDLNGFLMLVFFIYFLEHRATGNGLLLTLLFSLVLIVSVPFLSACSPDLPVIVLTAMGFDAYSRGITRGAATGILMIAAFAFTIKLSAVALILLSVVVVMVALGRGIVLGRRLVVFLSGVVLITLAKNIYQTGYSLFPYSFLGMPELSWATPSDLLNLYTSGLKSWALDTSTFFGSAEGWRNPTLPETVNALLVQEGFRGMFNTLIIFSFSVFVILAIWHLFALKRKYLITMPAVGMHVVFVITFLVWLAFAPQYRFILPIYVFYGAWAVHFVIVRIGQWDVMRAAEGIPYIAILVLLGISIFSVSVTGSSTSTEIGKVDAFNAQYLITPHVSYTFDGVDTLSIGDQQFYHVQGNSYCWDSPLPCMSAGYYRILQDRGYKVVTARDGRRWRFELVKRVSRVP